METKIDFGTVYERDMDLMFIEAFAIDKGFSDLFVEKGDFNVSDYKIVSIEKSHTDAGLGESDVTVIIESEGIRYGILIEDKIGIYLFDGEKGCYKPEKIFYRKQENEDN